MDALPLVAKLIIVKFHCNVFLWKFVLMNFLAVQYSHKPLTTMSYFHSPLSYASPPFRRPKILLEHELAISKRAAVSNQLTSKPIPPLPRRDTASPGSDKVQQQPAGVGLDSQFVDAIMTGEMCLRGVRSTELTEHISSV